MSLADKWERVRELVRKELLVVFRDPRLVRMVLVAPVVQLLVFGYAVSTDVRHTPTFVVDQDHSQTSRDLLNRLCDSPTKTAEARTATSQTLTALYGFLDACATTA